MEFSIRTQLTLDRFAQYEKELEAVWNDLTEAARATPRDEDEMQYLTLVLVYYWYNLMPLTRGTAGVGFAVINGLLLAQGYEV
jgi:hypothetical protein